MSDTDIKEAMDYEKQFATNNKLKSALTLSGMVG